MKILVTGAAGFIGMHVALRLLERGDEVVGPAVVEVHERPGHAEDGVRCGVWRATWRHALAVRSLTRVTEGADVPGRGLTVDEVMRPTGQGRTVFYRHFDDLADLLQGSLREMFTTIAGTLMSEPVALVAFMTAFSVDSTSMRSPRWRRSAMAAVAHPIRTTMDRTSTSISPG